MTEATQNDSFSQALQQPGVVKGQFDLLYASLCHKDDEHDDDSEVEEEEEEEEEDYQDEEMSSSAPSPPRGRPQHNGRGGKRWKGTSLITYANEESEEEECDDDNEDDEDKEEAVITKKRRRAIGHAQQSHRRRRPAPPPPLPQRYDEEELRHSWKPLGNAGDDYMEMTALGRRKELPLLPATTAKGARHKTSAAAAAAKRGGGNSTITMGEQGADWLQTRKAVVSERTSTAPTSTTVTTTTTSTASVWRTGTPSTVARPSPSVSSTHSAARSSGGNSTGSHQSKIAGTLFSPRPRFLGLSPEGGIGRGLRKPTGTAAAKASQVSSAKEAGASKSTLLGSGSKTKVLPPSALFNALKKSIFSPKAHC